MNNPHSTKTGIILIILCTLFTASGQILFKYGSEDFSFEIIRLLTNYHLLLGFVLYGMGAALLVLALKFGNLSVIYPFVSLTFIWVMFISAFIFGEVINSFKINAVILVIFGIVLIAGGSNG
ncbi:hypothetical protein HYU22_00670 [Candidatus Woesearchaeota archaeon]|nr:hypothetical protein [Candidatus Woesearchaeota archaeon]